jgi:cell shape-determining protein MreD
MTWLNTFFVLIAAFLAVFWEAAFPGVRNLFGAQVDLLPSLMVYAGLCANFTTVCLTALFGGLCFDSLSANPLGVTVLPLFIPGLAIYWARDLILRDQVFAQAVLGVAVSGAAAVMSLLLLLTTGHTPILGWGTLWQLLVMSLGGAMATPIFFSLFEWLQRTLIHTAVPETSFRPDREIRRGR